MMTAESPHESHRSSRCRCRDRYSLLRWSQRVVHCSCSLSCTASTTVSAHTHKMPQGFLGQGSFGCVTVVRKKDGIQEGETFALKSLSKLAVVECGQVQHIKNEKGVRSLAHSAYLFVYLRSDECFDTAVSTSMSSILTKEMLSAGLRASSPSSFSRCLYARFWKCSTTPSY